MWSRILSAVTGVIGSVAGFAPQLGALLALVKGLISVGLSAEEVRGMLGIRDVLRNLAEVLRDMASEVDDVADGIDEAVSISGDKGTSISYEEGEKLIKEIGDFTQFPGRLTDLSKELYAQSKKLT